MTQLLARFDPYVAAIDDEIREILHRDEPALAGFYEMMLYHLGLGAAQAPSGKRLRPLICLLVHEGLTGEFRPGLPVAAALELLHNFTLIHDDIEDHDVTRHHRPTVWAVWGIAQGINAGDGMYAISGIALQRLRRLSLDPARILEATYALDRVCMEVCEGQFLDIAFETRSDVTVEQYRAMVARKTGALMRASAEIPALLVTDDRRTLHALRSFGEHFGQAFQAHDDVRGIWGASEATGKTEMNDLAKRKMTLPMVLAFERAGGGQRRELERIYRAPASVDEAAGRGGAPLPAEQIGRVREILDALGVRADIDGLIERERALALAALAQTGLEAAPMALMSDLVREVTGS